MKDVFFTSQEVPSNLSIQKIHQVIEDYRQYLDKKLLYVPKKLLDENEGSRRICAAETIQKKKELLARLTRALNSQGLPLKSLYADFLELLKNDESQAILHAHMQGPDKNFIEIIVRAFAKAYRAIAGQKTHAEVFEEDLVNELTKKCPTVIISYLLK